MTGTITQSGSNLGEIKCYEQSDRETPATSFTYGDTIVVEFTPTPTGEPPAVNALAAGTDQAVLKWGEVELAAAQKDQSGAYTLTYRTGDQKLELGEHTLTVEYGGNSSMAGKSATINVTLSPKPVQLQVADISKVYDKTAGIAIPVSIASGDKVNAGDQITVTASGQFEQADMGDDIPIRDVKMETTGEDAKWYETSILDNLTGSITKSDSSLKVEMEEAYTYGNTITIKVTPDISAVNALSAEPNTVELIYNGKVITEATDEDGDGVYVLEYQTTEKELPIGTYQITISFGGDHNLNPQTWTGNITLNQKPVDAAIAGAITKPYDGDADITLNLNVNDLESGDSVTGTIAGTYDTQDVGDGKTIAISGEPNWTASGTTSPFLKPPTGSITRSSGSTLETTVKNGETETKGFTYGDDIIIVVTPKPDNTPPANQALLADDAPAMEVFYGEDNLNAEVQEADGVYTLTYHTADKRPPIGTGLTLTVKFHGDSNMGSGESVIEGVTLAKKSVSAVVDGTVTKPYDQNTDVPVSFKVEKDLVGEDTVTGTTTGAFEDKNVGTGKAVTVDAGDVVWNETSQ